MIKLLIVDDEPLVQIGIKSMISWANLGIEICGTAVNGAAALLCIEKETPDIVITDIRMPVMNGLELAAASRENYGKIPLFIFLTSYEEFQLIKEAMSCEAVDYLIKLELDADGLTNAVNKAILRLEELEATKQYQKSGRPMLQNYNEKFMMRLLYNLFDSEEQFSLQAKDLNLDFSGRCFQAAHCAILSEGNGPIGSGPLDNLYGSTQQLVRELLPKYLPCYVISLDRKHFAVIFHMEEPLSETFSTSPPMEALIREACQNACVMTRNYFSVRLSMGIGSAWPAPMRICESYQEARLSFAEAAEGEAIRFFTSNRADSIKNSFNISLFKKDLTKAFEEFDTDVLHRILTEIIQLFSAHPLRFPQAADGACNILYLALSLLPEGEATLQEIFSGYSDGYRSLYRFSNADQVTDWLCLLRDGLCDILKRRKKTYKDHVITNVQRYIGTHIHQRLTLNEVAGVFGLSPNYLSILFKKNSDMGFSEYITNAKIAKAKPLLLEQDVKIYEIADRLGFDSAFYFSKVFKKVEGLSPREFIQQNTLSPSREAGLPKNQNNI